MLCQHTCIVKGSCISKEGLRAQQIEMCPPGPPGSLNVFYLLSQRLEASEGLVEVLPGLLNM